MYIFTHAGDHLKPKMVLNKLADLEEICYINSEEEREENCISCWKQKQRDENFHKSLRPNLISFVVSNFKRNAF